MSSTWWVFVAIVGIAVLAVVVPTLLRRLPDPQLCRDCHDPYPGPVGGRCLACTQIQRAAEAAGLEHAWVAGRVAARGRYGADYRRVVSWALVGAQRAKTPPTEQPAA